VWGRTFDGDANKGQVEGGEAGLHLEVSVAHVQVVAVQQVTHHVDRLVVQRWVATSQQTGWLVGF